MYFSPQTSETLLFLLSLLLDSTESVRISASGPAAFLLSILLQGQTDC